MASSVEIAENLYGYDDYRAFLREWFEAKKVEKATFSLRAFSLRAGFAAHNFCTYLVSGERNCSADSARKIAKAIGLKARSADFFENLVLFNQAKTTVDCDYYYERMKKAGRSTSYKKLERDQFPFYEKWYYPVLRELMVLSDWNGDCARLAAMVLPPIACEEAEEAVAFLLRTGMVIRGESGKCALAHVVVTSETVPIAIKRRSRHDVLLQGVETIDAVAPTDKYIAYSTVAMSRDCFADIRKILDESREAVIARIAADCEPTDVYEVVFQVFPVTRTAKKAGPEGA